MDYDTATGHGDGDFSRSSSGSFITFYVPVLNSELQLRALCS